MEVHKQIGPISRLVTMLIGLPAVAAILLVSTYVLELSEQVEDAKRSQEAVELIRVYSDTAHQLAIERGLTNGILASPQNGSQFDRLHKQWNKTDKRIKNLRTFTFQHLDAQKNTHLLDDLFNELKLLSEIREQVQELTPGIDPFLYYSTLNQMIISNAMTINNFNQNEKMNRLGNALLSVMEMAEKAGKVRGLLNGAFSRQYSDVSEYVTFEHYLMSEKEAKRMTRIILPDSLKAEFQTMEQSEYWKTVDEIVTSYESQMNSLGSLNGPAPEYWFLMASERIALLANLSEKIHGQMLVETQRQLTRVTYTQNWVLIVTVVVSLGLIWGVFFTRNLERHLNHTTAELIHSIRDLKLTQDQLVQAEKLAALGRLVAGVAHEVNTPLGIAVTASSYIDHAINDIDTRHKKKTLTNDKFKSIITQAKESSVILESNLHRAANLIQDFKQTAVDQVSENLSEFNVHQVMSALITSLHPETRKIPVKPEIDGDSSVVMKSLPGVLTQVISNLVINSVIHAFSNQQTPKIRINYQQQQEKVVFEYQDNGKGVPPELHQKIFEPFYTTKRGQGGTGLGLNLVFNLVTHKLKGKLTFSSDENQGVRFTLTLPRDIEATN